MPEEIRDKDGKIIGYSHRTDLEEELATSLSKSFPNLLPLIEPLFTERQDRDKINSISKKEQNHDNLVERVNINESLRDKAFAIMLGYWLMTQKNDNLKDTINFLGEYEFKWIEEQAELKHWLTVGLTFGNHFTSIQNKREFENLETILFRVLSVIAELSPSLRDKFGNRKNPYDGRI